MGQGNRTKVQQIEWDDHVIAKIWRKHRLESWEVEEATLDDERAEFRWNTSRRHGRRLLVRGRTHRGRALFIVLSPVDRSKGIWRCRTAWEETR